MPVIDIGRDRLGEGGLVGDIGHGMGEQRDTAAAFAVRGLGNQRVSAGGAKIAQSAIVDRVHGGMGQAVRGAAAIERRLVDQHAGAAPSLRVDDLVETRILEPPDIVIELLGPLDPEQRDVVGIDEAFARDCQRLPFPLRIHAVLARDSAGS